MFSEMESSITTWSCKLEGELVPLEK